jgi:hypothetical protein
MRRPVGGLVLVTLVCLLALGPVPRASAAGPGYFTPTAGSMSTWHDVAAPLPDGRVLVAGYDTAEIFDPATETFSSIGGRLSTPRSGAVAAPLPDGRVLIAGGCCVSQQYLSSAEIFDPATNTFSSAGVGSMSVPRYGAVAAPLPDGRVLVAGGCCSPTGPYESSAEVFDPSTNSFSSAGIGSMTEERQDAVAAPLPDGRVLVAGGEHGGWVLANAEIFDPATNTFSSAGVGSMSTYRPGAVAAPLPDGRVLVAGGVHDNLYPCYLSDAEVFDPATNSFNSDGIGSMSVPRTDGVAAPLSDGVLVASGYYSYDSLLGRGCPDRDLGPSGTSAEIFRLGVAPHTPPQPAPVTPTCRGIVATIVGTEGNDVRRGTPGRDVFAGMAGDDRLSGLAGNDLICGGDGNDTLKGGDGKDTLYGEAGRDTLKGGPGNDKLRGGPGKDLVVRGAVGAT